MTESRQIELRPGDMVFACHHEDGPVVMTYTYPGVQEDVFDAFAAFMRACGYHPEDYLPDDGDWAVRVRNFLNELTNPEAYGYAVSREVVKLAAELRDA